MTNNESSRERQIIVYGLINGIGFIDYRKGEKGRDIEKMCEYVAGRLGDAVVKKIFSLHKPKYEIPDVLSEPEDSSQTQE